MSVRLIAEVVRYLKTPPGAELTTGERLVLLLIAERARHETREAWPGGSDRWDLGTLTGMPPTTLRSTLQRLAKRGLEVRVSHGVAVIKKGKHAGTERQVFAGWNRQTTYRLPILLGDDQSSPTGDDQSSPTSRTRRRNPTPQATKSHPLGDDQSSTGDDQSSPYPSSPSGSVRNPDGRTRARERQPSARSRDARTSVPQPTAADIAETKLMYYYLPTAGWDPAHAARVAARIMRRYGPEQVTAAVDADNADQIREWARATAGSST